MRLFFVLEITWFFKFPKFVEISHNLINFASISDSLILIPYSFCLCFFETVLFFVNDNVESSLVSMTSFVFVNDKINVEIFLPNFSKSSSKLVSVYSKISCNHPAQSTSWSTTPKLYR